MTSTPSSECDVVVVGGALAGAASALLLLEACPGIRVLIVEKHTAFPRKVGEATVEVSAYFLGRVLGLTRHLNDAHLVKQGLRFWFANDSAQNLAECSEIGGGYLARVPSYQVDRSVLDEEVLARARDKGAEVWRGAHVAKIVLHPGGSQVLEVRRGNQPVEVRARWVIDASGVAAFLARKEGWHVPNKAHPTASVWARWRGVKDWDGLELARKYPDWSRSCHGIRNTATNHLMGPGWWAWCIPLKGGDVSVGVVFDQRLVTFPDGPSLGQRLKDFLSAHPVGREIMADAQWTEGDVHWRKNLPYSSTTYAGDGFALVGDAGAFLDPFYSPGMDWIAFSVSATVALISAQREGKELAPRIERHNRDFRRSYDRWFEALYLGKYNYLGEFDLMKAAFLLDIGLYYMGVVSQPFLRGASTLAQPVFSLPPSVPFFHLMRLYNRRLGQIGRSRRTRGALGRKNKGNQFLFGGYTFSPKSVFPILKGLRLWLALELAEGWRSWFGSAREAGEGTPMLAKSAVAPKPGA